MLRSFGKAVGQCMRRKAYGTRREACGQIAAKKRKKSPVEYAGGWKASVGSWRLADKKWEARGARWEGAKVASPRWKSLKDQEPEP